MFDDEYDVVIVGARIAGSITAALIGDAGYRVLLIDRARFPSSTISTHFFRGERALSVFKRLDVLDDILALGPPPLTCQYVYVNGAAEALIQPAQLPGEIGYCLSVRREPLDSILIRRAQRSRTVQFIDQTSLTGLIREDGRIVGVNVQHAGKRYPVRAKIIVGADGRNSMVAREVDAPYEEFTAGFRALYYRYIRHFTPPLGDKFDGPEFSFLENQVAYVFPSDNGMTCVALTVSLEDFQLIKHDADKHFTEHLSRHKGIGGRFRAAMPDGKLWGTGPQPNYVRVPFGPGWALVGDSALHQDPWSGHGIDKASTHATMLAEAIVAGLTDPANEPQALAMYQQKRNETALSDYHETIYNGRDFRQPFET